MRVKPALALLAGGALLLAALACETEAPPTTAPVPAATAAPISAPVAAATPSPVPTATARPTPVPTATPLPEGVGICYRTPEVQEWIIQQLQIPSCRLITEPELYRIKAEFRVNAELRPGDLSGLANVPSVYIHYGHCGNWEDPAYAAAMLDGLNPNAALRIDSPLEWAGGEEGRGEVIIQAMAGNVQSAESVGMSYGLSENQAESLIKQAQALKMRTNTRARAIAAVVAETRGKENPLIRIPAQGHAVFGKPPEPGSVEVRVGLVIKGRHADRPECREE